MIVVEVVEIKVVVAHNPTHMTENQQLIRIMMLMMSMMILM